MAEEPTDDDGLPLDQVGAWAKQKHERLRKYVDASRAARRKFVEGSGGAAYVDLFCGSGRALVRETGERIDGSPLLAFKSARDGGVPFSEMHIADLSSERVAAAKTRVVGAGGQAFDYHGNASITATQIVDRLNPYGLHFAFLDPFNLQDLPFSIFETFSRLRRIDLLIHISAQDLQRNLQSYIAPGDDRLDQFAPGWRNAVDTHQAQQAIRASILDYWASRLSAWDCLCPTAPNSSQEQRKINVCTGLCSPAAATSRSGFGTKSVS